MGIAKESWMDLTPEYFEMEAVMAVTWTDEQRRVIDTRECNILVSAAAGSGKTAVLVARILALITDGQHPVDIDRLLVVTFTNAAAAEMRERIRDALERRAAEEPDNVHLQRQLVLVHNAKITTIHSFCLHVLRNHFQTVGIDPAFRVADQGEVLLLEQDAVQEIVDEAYEAGTEEFHRFLEEFASGKHDRVVEEAVLQLYHFALGQPWPRRWLRQCRAAYAATDAPEPDGTAEQGQTDGTDLRQDDAAKNRDGLSGDGTAEQEQTDGTESADRDSAPWLACVAEDTARLLADLEEQLQQALEIAGEPDGPYPYIKALQSDMELVEQLRRGTDYYSYAQAFAALPPHARLSAKKDDRIDEQKKLLVQELRGAVKDGIQAIRKRYYYDAPETLRQELLRSGNTVRVLTNLTEAFFDRIGEKKAGKNIVDFGDLEHLALQVLAEPMENGAVPTAAAREYAETFAEIMIDEYQDSNLVQELILNCVAGHGRGRKNLFMVGDVKQSIYRFRLARPELFMEKYKTYREAKEGACRIDLHRNFRSRPQVLEGVNAVFRQIMTESLGGIVYDSDAALYPGASFGGDIIKEGTGDFLTPECLLLEASGQERQRQEAQLVGRRIREIVGREQVWDKELEAYRPARYGDIVILLRTVSGWAEPFGEALADLGIPCHTGAQEGYFSAAEVRVVLAYLQILDNPIQDIPLAAVLRSAIGGFTDEELALIRSASGRAYFYDCCQEYRNSGENAALREKLDGFFADFERLRRKCGHTPVHLLLWEILDVTGYGDYAEALPAGRQRRANLDMLVEKAIAYEATSYRGLYHFVRYIENLKKYEIDYGEASAGAESADVVRIMSIHKSKGLEFPVVFVSGLGKQFNESDSRSRVALHPELGIGCDCVDAERRTRRASLLKKTIQQRIITENLGEELRVLYVAMTRAMEKLILTGCVSDAEKHMETWRMAARRPGETLSYAWLSGASTYLDWVMPALLRCQGGGAFELRMVTALEQALEERRSAGAEAGTLERLLSLDETVCCDEAARAYLEQAFSSVYPYERDRDIIGKLSVSELKKMSHMTEEQDAQELYREETVIPLLPRFCGGEEAITGAARGTVYHTFMENLDFSRKDELEIQLEELQNCGKMSAEERAALALPDIRAFLASGCGRRMERAALRGQLYRERPFVLGTSAQKIRSGWNPQETVLVQGIIDAYFIEDGEITVVDYKTDRVARAQMLADKYRAQLDYYALALTRLTGLPVRSRIIYSFYLGEEIVL